MALERRYVEEVGTMNLFVVKDGAFAKPFTTACLEGLTRASVLRLVRANGFTAVERDVSLLEIHTADEVFATGTVAEIVPVVDVDGRVIGDGVPGPLTLRVRELYRGLTSTAGVRIPAVEGQR